MCYLITMPSSDTEEFCRVLSASHKILVISGAGLSAASLPLNARRTRSVGALKNKSKANVNEGKQEDTQSDGESTTTAVSEEEPVQEHFDFEQRLKGSSSVAGVVSSNIIRKTRTTSPIASAPLAWSSLVDCHRR